jgi:alkanesulfonate monooxygenase SsuD/methylene tetrahydromethanopterin reductase-like flavin-dependent oxidoreductase (luciferase family)
MEHDALGFEFGTFTDRFVRLDEALQIIVPMLAGERPTVQGTWYRVREAINEPRLRPAHWSLTISAKSAMSWYQAEDGNGSIQAISKSSRWAVSGI